MFAAARDTFDTFGVAILCIALAIMALAIFFTGLQWLGRRGAKLEPLAVRGVLKKDAWVTVHMAGDEIFDDVRFLGFTRFDSPKDLVPFDLHGMVILEDRAGLRRLVRAKAIRMIVVPPARQTP